MLSIVNRARGIIGGAGFILLLIGLVVLQADWKFGVATWFVASLFLAPFWLPWAMRRIEYVVFVVWLGGMAWASLSGHPWIFLGVLAGGLVSVSLILQFKQQAHDRREAARVPHHVDPGVHE